MKSLTHIAVTALKNHARTSIEIPRLLALQGDNGAGKSSLLQAIRIGVLGYDPAIGKTLALTRKLVQVGRDQARVDLRFNDGLVIERGVGKSLETRVLPPKGERKDSEFEARIEDETGKFLVSFDLAAFISLSAEKQRAYLLNILPRRDVDLDQRLWREWLGFEGAEDFIRTAIDKLWTDKVLADQSLLDGLASALAHTHEHVLAADQARRDQEKVSAAAERDALTASALTGPDDLADRLPALQRDLGEVQRQIGEIDEKRAEFDRTAERARRHEHDVAVVQSNFDRAAAAITRIEADRVAVPANTDDVAQLAEDLDRAERKSHSQRDAVRYNADGLSTTTVHVATLEKQIRDLGTADECPTCGSDAKVKDLRPALQANLETASAKQAEWRNGLQAAQDQQRRFDEEVASLKIRIRTAEERQRKIERFDNDLKMAAAQRDNAEQQLDRLKLAAVELPAEPTFEERSGLVLRQATIELDIKNAQLALREAGKGDAARERADKERGSLEVKTKRWEALKGIYTAQQKLRAHVIEQLVGPVEATANELLQAIDIDKQFRFVFEREGKLDFDFGFEEDGVFRSYDAASTGEDAFLAVVLVAALIAAVKPAWSVLMVDNAETIDDVRRRDLMDALGKFSDRFGNVILAGCCSFDASEAWTVIEMSEGVALRRVAA